MGAAWRIVRESRAQTAFTGEGPWRFGGRWNSPGIRIVYVSEHQSTAALEIFIHRVPFVTAEKFKAFRIEWPDNIMEILATAKLPAKWRMAPRPAETVAIGDQWALQKRSVVLAVPSAISPDDRNFLLNPEHPNFKRIRIAALIDYDFDPRLFGR